MRAYYEYNGVIMYSNRLEFSKCTKPRTFTSSFKYTPLGSYRCLHWQKLSNVSGYIIYKYDIAHNKYTRVKKISSYKTTSCILPALKSGFGYRILAYKNVNGSIVYGDISKAPAKASSLSGTVIDSRSVSGQGQEPTNVSSGNLPEDQRSRSAAANIPARMRGIRSLTPRAQRNTPDM